MTGLLMDKKYYAFGKEVPEEEIMSLMEEGMKEEEITTEFLEGCYWYEYHDNL